MVKERQGERVRLYVRGVILGYKRSKSNQYPNTSLIQIEGVNTREEVEWYQDPSSREIYLQSQWEGELGFSCTPATYKCSLTGHSTKDRVTFFTSIL
ncbi:hypothetical protein SUGI_0950080 [Cryptomeria japonica]|nr:hypothetical protein SUGI_0950080 [Cryptomeria japonica]